MPETIVITGASSGFGAMTARALADAGHTVHAGMRDTAGRNAPAAAAATDYAAEHGVDLRPVVMDVSDQESVDAAIADAYDARYAGLMDQVSARLAELAPDDTDPTEVARRIVEVVDTPKGERPFRVHVDPAQDGAEEVNRLGDRVRADFYRRIGPADLLRAAH